MQKKKLTTSIANWLRYNRSRESLDESAKQLLSNLVVLAWILKYSVEEFSEYDIEEIEDMIEGEPDISKIRLEPGLSVIHPPDYAKGTITSFRTTQKNI